MELWVGCPVTWCTDRAQWLVVDQRTGEQHPFCETHANWSINAHLN